MYRLLTIYKFKNNMEYKLHMSTTYVTEAFFSEMYKDSLLRISGKETDIENIFDSFDYIDGFCEEERITFWMWYIQYYIIYNNLECKIIPCIKNQYFKFIEKNNV